MADFRLIETMRVSPAGEVYLLERHLARLSRSARHFSFSCDVAEVRAAIAAAAVAGSSAVRLRLTLAADGVATMESAPIPSGYVERLELSRLRVNSADQFLYHKTTNRHVYEEARRACDEHTDVMLVNEKGEITETPIMNIAVLREGRWVTPAVSCGLLPGVMREELLHRGEIVEGIVPAADLEPGTLVRCFNALRGVFDIRARSSDILRD